MTAYDIRKVAVVFLIKQGDKYLFQKRINTGYCDGYYLLPGGHVDAGETVLQAAVRELREELGIRVLPNDLTFKLVHPLNTHIVFFFEVQKYTGTISNQEPDKHSDVSFLRLDHPEILPEVCLEVRQIEQNQFFLE